MHGLLLLAGNEDARELLRPFDSSSGTNERFDWFQLGGRFGPALPLRVPRATRRFFGLLPGPLKQGSVAATKKEVQVEIILRSPPTAFLFNGCWAELPLDANAEAVKIWQREFAQLFAAVPDDTLLRIIDIHRSVG